MYMVFRYGRLGEWVMSKKKHFISKKNVGEYGQALNKLYMKMYLLI